MAEAFPLVWCSSEPLLSHLLLGLTSVFYLLCNWIFQSRYNSYILQFSLLKCTNHWFLIVTKCCNHPHSNFRTLSSFQKDSPCSLAVILISPQPPLIQGKSLISFLSASVFLFWKFHINEIIQYVAFCVWILPLSVMFSRFICVAACISTLFLFIAEQRSIVWMFHGLIISSLDGSLGCFHFQLYEHCHERLCTRFCVNIRFHSPQ